MDMYMCHSCVFTQVSIVVQGGVHCFRKHFMENILSFD